MTTAFASRFHSGAPDAQQRRAALAARLDALRALEERAAAASARSQPQFDKRGQLLPRQRVALLLDAGAPWLPLCTLAGYLQDVKDPAKSVPGGGMIAGIGLVSGVRCMVVASDSGIEAGAIQPMGLEKILRVQEIALRERLPFVHLVESAGANLMRYRVEGFVHGGTLFRNLARLSATGIPVITVQHGSGTAGGAYMPGLSDVVIMVQGRSRAFLAGPPLLMAATGEIATEEELGGAEMHTAVSGLGEYLALDDREAIGMARDVIAQTGWAAMPRAAAPAPTLPADDLLALMPADLRQPVDMREVIARLVDGSELLEFKARYGMATLCAQGRIGGHAVAGLELEQLRPIHQPRHHLAHVHGLSQVCGHQGQEVVSRQCRRRCRIARHRGPAGLRDHVACHADGLAVVQRQVFAQARDGGVHLGAAQFFFGRDLARGGLEQRRPGQKSARASLHHDDHVRQPGHVGAACRARTVLHGDDRNPCRRQPREVAEQGAPVHEAFDPVAHEVGARTLDQVHEGQALAQSDLLHAEYLFQPHGLDGPRLDAGVAGHHHAAHTADKPDTGDHPAAGHGLFGVLHILQVARQGAQRQPGRARVQQQCDALARQQLAALVELGQ